MTDKAPIEIRPSTGADSRAIEAMYPLAFPDEDLVPLVDELLDEESIRLSLVATLDGQVVGHVVFTACGIENERIAASLLGPLGVTPEHQKRGIGGALVRDGLRLLLDDGVAIVCVLGDPGYYGRFGFRPEHRLEPPYPMPEEWRDAWQSLCLGDTAHPGAGKLAVPAQWQHPELWGP